jgi:hypothetical protein
MNETKGWNEFFSKEEPKLLKENISISPNQMSIIRQEEDEGIGYYLQISTPHGNFYTELRGGRYDDYDEEGEQ